MRSVPQRHRTLLTLLAASTVCAGARAQFRASIQGTVSDPTGAVVPGAAVALTDVANNKTLNAKANADGLYSFSALPPDRFTLTVTAPGFKQNVIQGLTIIPEQANSVNVQLQLGDATTSVTVSGDTDAAVDTETANIGGTVSSNDIQHLPSFNRDVFTLSQLTPGTISDGSQASGGGVFTQPGNQGPGGTGAGGAPPTENGVQSNANGQQYETNSISIDGISTTSAVWGGTTVITPSEESVDNVRIVTNDYDAENGRFSGSQTLVTSKSGTNQLHGSAFIAIHRPGLNAFQRSTGTGAPVKDTQRFNQYGGSLGGPILKDRVFAFFSFESTPNSSTLTSFGWYDTPAFDALAPANSIASKFVTFPGNGVLTTGIVTNNETCTTVGLTEGVTCRTIPGQGLNLGSPLTAPLGKHDPTETGTPTNPGVGNGLTNVADIAYYATSTPSTSYYRQFNGRVDADATKRDHLAFAIYWVPQGNTGFQGGSRAYDAFNHNQINDAFSVIWNHTFSPTLLNEARANAAGFRWNEITDNPQQPVGLPADAIDAFGSATTVNQFGSQLGSILNQWTYGYKDVATKTAGRHTVKFGGEYTSLHYLSDPIGRPGYTFYNIWDFLNDAPQAENGNFDTVTGLPGGVRADDRENLFGGFVQDDWKVKANLTLHAGVRYSYFGALYSKQNNLSTLEFGTGSSLYTGAHVRVGGGLYTPGKGDFGPQVGFNWSPDTFHTRLVVRGGYGLNFNQEEISLTANANFNPPSQGFYNFHYNSPADVGNGSDILYGISGSPTSLAGFAANANTVTAYNNAGLPVSGNASVAAFGRYDGSSPTPYAHHYSLNTDYQLGREIVFSLGYQGSSSHHLLNHENVNAPGAVAGVALNPLITGNDFWTNSGIANNNALLAEIKHPFLHGFSLDAQYLWAKSLDTDGSGPYSEDPYFPLNPAYSYGRSDFNVGQSFKTFGLWQPVFFRGSHGWVEKIAGGWSLSGIFNLHSGFPWSPNYGLGSSLYCSNCGYYNLRPQYLGGARGDRSNRAFEALPNTAASNFPTLGTGVQTGNKNNYANNDFLVPDYTASITPQAAGFPATNVALPNRPGADRNSFTGPGYRDVDGSLTKGFGLPNTRLLGESARLEIRADVFNVFNLLNLNPSNINNNVNAANFGQDTTALGARTIAFQGRFSF